MEIFQKQRKARINQVNQYAEVSPETSFYADGNKDVKTEINTDKSKSGIRIFGMKPIVAGILTLALIGTVIIATRSFIKS